MWREWINGEEIKQCGGWWTYCLCYVRGGGWGRPEERIVLKAKKINIKIKVDKII